MSTLITPRTLSGFRDYLPDVMLAREKVLQIARDVYRSYGFTPIDTPACEALDVLLGKGGDESDKLVYRVRSAKSDKEEMGLRFDLTVPFARFSAQYINQIGTPFKRYAMGPVWRGERPGQPLSRVLGSATSTPSHHIERRRYRDCTGHQRPVHSHCFERSRGFYQ